MYNFIGFGEVDNIEELKNFYFIDVKTKNAAKMKFKVSTNHFEEGESVKIFKNAKGHIFIESDIYYKEFYRASVNHLFFIEYNAKGGGTNNGGDADKDENKNNDDTDIGILFGSSSAFLLLEDGNDVEKLGHSSISDGGQFFAGKGITYSGVNFKNYDAKTIERSISKHEQCSELKGNRLFCSSLDTKLTYEFSISSIDPKGTLQKYVDVHSYETTELEEPFHKTLGLFGMSVLALSKITKIKGEGIECFTNLINTDNLIFNETHFDFNELSNSLINIGVKSVDVIEFEMALMHYEDEETIKIGNSFKNINKTKVLFSNIPYRVTHLKLITAERTVEISLSKVNLYANVENYAFYSFMGYEHIGFNQSFEIDNPIKITSGKVVVDMSGEFDMGTTKTIFTSTDTISMSVDDHKIYIDQQGTKATN